MPNKAVPRVFVDTNVIFSALYGSENCQKIIEAHIKSQVAMVISEKVLLELVKNITSKLPSKLPLFQDFFINSPPEIVSDQKVIRGSIGKLIDIKDRYIFASAMVANLKYFVTGNTKDFKRERLEKLTKIKILNPTELMVILKL